MSITAKELAEKLGLSAAAVSMALNHKPGVSESTRDQVLKAAKEYGYDFRRRRLAEEPKKGSIAFLMYRRHGGTSGKQCSLFSAPPPTAGGGNHSRIPWPPSAPDLGYFR